jgi:membrane associated rhomboid family serine protease
VRYPPQLTNKNFVAHFVTAMVGVAALFATLAWWIHGYGSVFLQDIRAFHTEPWRFVTSTFLHVDVMHLVFNLYWLWVFGTLVEEAFGHLRTAGLLLVLASGSAVIAGVFGEDGVGLSGVGYGLFGLLWVLSRRDERFTGAVDSQTVALFVGWFFLCILLTLTGVLNVGNVAHGAGAVLGTLIGLAIADRERRWLYTGLVTTAIVLSFVAGILWRPNLNLFGSAGHDLAFLGYLELERGRPEKAVELTDGRLQPTTGRRTRGTTWVVPTPTLVIEPVRRRHSSGRLSLSRKTKHMAPP